MNNVSLYQSQRQTNDDKYVESGLYLIDSVKHYKIGSSCDIYKRLYTHSTSLGIPNVRLIIYTKQYKLLEKAILHKLKKYLVTESREIIDVELISLCTIIKNIIEICDVLNIKYTADYNYKFVKNNPLVKKSTGGTLLKYKVESDTQVKNIQKKRGSKIDIKWYMSDFTRATKLKISIVHNDLKGELSEIAELCKIICESNLDNVKYLYIIFNSYLNSYEIFVLFNKQIKEYDKARIRLSIYTWNNNCDYKVENNKMTNKELSVHLSSYYTNELVYVHAIKPIFSKTNEQSSQDKLRRLVIQVMNKLNIKVVYMSNTLVDCNYNEISITDAMHLIRQDPLLKNASIKNLYEISMELEFKNGFGEQFIRSLYPTYKP
jgi:hypothetical protein